MIGIINNRPNGITNQLLSTAIIANNRPNRMAIGSAIILAIPWYEQDLMKLKSRYV